MKSPPVDRITERIQLRKSRIGQGKFREDVLARWDGQCAVSPISKPELLRASHIKPWSTCDNSQEKLDPFNGLALAQNYDGQFDSGFISFDEDGRIIISERLEVWETQTLGISERARLRQL
ncbi:MAG: HNH endonuclease [Candidatus Thalassarchaeum sp.]|nr:HNH endonuclease [Candidatus Thalassarchaeum sp.]